MTSAHVMAEVREGMEVRSADGRTVGRVARLWFGDDPTSSAGRCDEEVCSRVEVHLAHHGGVRYIPYNALGHVEGRTLVLSVDEATMNNRLWHQRPLWMPPEDTGDQTVYVRSHRGANM